MRNKTENVLSGYELEQAGVVLHTAGLHFATCYENWADQKVKILLGSFKMTHYVLVARSGFHGSFLPVMLLELNIGHGGWIERWHKRRANYPSLF